MSITFPHLPSLCGVVSRETCTRSPTLCSASTLAAWQPVGLSLSALRRQDQAALCEARPCLEGVFSSLLVSPCLTASLPRQPRISRCQTPARLITHAADTLSPRLLVAQPQPRHGRENIDPVLF